jgi:hypothetical protein
MQDISFYLKKFENLGLKEKNIKKSLIDIVKKESGVELEDDDIKLVSDQIKINKTGPEKTEIFIHKPAIEKAINEFLNNGESREVEYSKKIK